MNLLHFLIILFIHLAFSISSLKFAWLRMMEAKMPDSNTFYGTLLRLTPFTLTSKTHLAGLIQHP